MIERCLQELTSTMVVVVIAVPFVLLARPRWAAETRKALLQFAAVLAVYQMLVVLPRIVPALWIAGLTYNWSGKLLSFGFGLSCIYLFRVCRPTEAGWTLRQTPGSLRPTLLLLAVVVFLETPMLWFVIGAEQVSIEDHLFQLTLPGLDEELMFRGVLLVLLERALPPKHTLAGARFGWAALTTAVLFGAVHTVQVQRDWSIQFYWFAGALPAAGALIFIWMRTRTGSLVIPIILHNLMNEVAQIIAWLKVPDG